MCDYSRVTVSAVFFKNVVCTFCICVFAQKGDHEHRPPMRVCIVLPLQRDWCHKIAQVKFVHSVAHKGTFPEGQLQ